MNETIVVENGQAAVATTSVSGTLSPASSATDTIAIVDTPAGKQAALKVYNLNGGGGGGGEVSGDYLPLSGGTMTGNIFMAANGQTSSYNIKFANPSNPTSSTYYYKLGRDASGSDNGFGIETRHGGNTARYFFTLSSFCAQDWYSGGKINLGNPDKPWKTIYVKAINNGADLIIPTEGGTLARLEDIQNAGGGGGLPDNIILNNGTSLYGGEAIAVGENTVAHDGSVSIGSRAKTDINGVAIGRDADASTNQSVAIGMLAKATGLASIAIGPYATVTANYAIQLGGNDYVSNTEANTLKVCLGWGKEQNYTLIDANGNVPLERLTYVTNQIGDISAALTAILGE